MKKTIRCHRQSAFYCVSYQFNLGSRYSSISVFFLSAFIVAVVFNGYIQEMIFGYTYFVARNFASKNSSGSILVELSFSNMVFLPFSAPSFPFSFLLTLQIGLLGISLNRYLRKIGPSIFNGIWLLLLLPHHKRVESSFEKHNSLFSLRFFPFFFFLQFFCALRSVDRLKCDAKKPYLKLS